MSIKGRNSVANLPKFELIQAFMHVIVTCKNEEDPIQNKSSGPHGLREEDFFIIFSYCMTMGDDDTRGVANLDPRGIVEYHLTLLHTKYASFRPCGFREEDF